MRRLLVLFTLAAVAALPLAAEEADETQLPRVEMATSMGTIVLELYPDKAPKTVRNFLNYVSEGLYECTVFHRVIPGFMVQGGGFDEGLNLRPPAGTIQNEADNGLKNARGTIAMARRSNPDSATCQFYINLVDNPALDHRSKDSARDWGYAVFGRVTAGMDAVDAIAGVRTGPGPKGMRDVPVEPVRIEGAVWVNGPAEEQPTATID